MLLHHNIKPVLVFDGRNLPSKAHTEKKRRSKRFEPFFFCAIRFSISEQEGEQRKGNATVEGRAKG